MSSVLLFGPYLHFPDGVPREFSSLSWVPRGRLGNHGTFDSFLSLQEVPMGHDAWFREDCSIFSDLGTWDVALHIVHLRLLVARSYFSILIFFVCVCIRIEVRDNLGYGSSGATHLFFHLRGLSLASPILASILQVCTCLCLSSPPTPPFFLMF